VICVHDDAGNVIEMHEHKAISKTGEREAKQKAATPVKA